jgi:hypothetical protein
MSLDPSTKRRCAALAVFTPVLAEDALMDTLWMLHESLRGDTARDIIAAVDRVAQRHGLDPRTCKRLYEGFYRALHLPDNELPLDPWPAMQALRPASAAAPVAGPAAWPTAAAPAVGGTRPPPLDAAPAQAIAATPPPAPVVPDLPAHVLVFGTLMQALLADIRQLHGAEMDDLRASAITTLDGTKLNAQMRATVREAWQRGPDATWHIDLNPKGLSELVHVMYVALCETLGPVDADQVLTRAVKQAELVPAARSFSPKQFL